MRTVTTGVPIALRRSGIVTGDSGTSISGMGTADSALAQRSTLACNDNESVASAVSGSKPMRDKACQSLYHDNAMVRPMRARERTTTSLAFTCSAENATAARSGSLAINSLSASAKVNWSSDVALCSAAGRSSTATSDQKSCVLALRPRTTQRACLMPTVAPSSMVSTANVLSVSPSTIASAAGSLTPPLRHAAAVTTTRKTAITRDERCMRWD